MLRLSSTTGQRQRKEEQQVSRNSPGWRFPQGQRVSVPDCRKGLPAFPRRRQEVCACADRPAETFFLFHRARRIFFLMSLCGAPAAPRAVGRGGARERAQFSPQAETELSGLCDDDNGGRIPHGQCPLREQIPPRPPPGGPASPKGRLFTSPFPSESGNPYSKRRIPSSEIPLLIYDTASSSRTVPRS